MSWTPATPTGPRAAHPSRIRVRATNGVCESRPGREHRESTDLFRSFCEGFDLGGKEPSPRRPSLYLPLQSSESFLQHLCAPFACRTWRCESPFPQVEMRPFCTIFVQSKSFRCNTSEPPPMCCKQRTCAKHKSRRCNAYKKQGVGAYPYFLASTPPLPGGALSGVN